MLFYGNLLQQASGSYLSTLSVWSAPEAGSSAGVGEYAVRIFLASADLVNTAGRTPSQVRVTLVGATSNPAVIGAVYFGKAGSAPSFSGDQVRLLFSGGTTATLTAGGSLVSDWVNYSSLTGGNSYIVSMGFNAGTYSSSYAYSAPPFSNSIMYYLAGDFANAGTTTVSGYLQETTILTLSLVETR